MKIRIRHETLYTSAEPARRAVQYLRLTPRTDRCQRVLSWTVSGPTSLVPWIDGFGNRAHVASQANHTELRILVEGEVETQDTSGMLPLDDGLPPGMFLRETPLTALDDALRGLAAPFAPMRKAKGSITALHGLMLAIADRLPYLVGATGAETTAAEAMARGCGVCQDHAHVFIACCRAIGVPARYVSGYLAGEHDGMASHAWAEAHVEDVGWISFDPSNRQSATDSYVRLAVGFDYASAGPVIGSRAGGMGEDLMVRLQVEQLQN